MGCIFQVKVSGFLLHIENYVSARIPVLPSRHERRYARNAAGAILFPTTIEYSYLDVILKLMIVSLMGNHLISTTSSSTTGLFMDRVYLLLWPIKVF